MRKNQIKYSLLGYSKWFSVGSIEHSKISCLEPIININFNPLFNSYVLNFYKMLTPKLFFEIFLIKSRKCFLNVNIHSIN